MEKWRVRKRKMYRRKAGLYKKHHNGKQRSSDSPFHHNRNIKSNVLWTACHIQFLKQNISYWVFCAESHFPTAFCRLFALFNFKESNRLLIVSLPIPFILFFILLELLFPNGISRAASPQGSLLIICWVSSSFCKIQALSLATATNFSSCAWLTFLLILRSCSKGFQI